MTDHVETQEFEVADAEETVVLETEEVIISAPLRPRLPAYVSHF